MKVTETGLPGVFIVEASVYHDARGYFFEAHNAAKLQDHGIDLAFVQDNVSYSNRGVLRGLHYQWPEPQGKFVQVLGGAVWDVAVDIRAGSPTFRQWFGLELSDENHLSLYIPPGFAHGFCVTGEDALVSYKCTSPYIAVNDAGIAWNDPELGIDWPVNYEPVLSEKDKGLPLLREILPERQPRLSL